MPFFPHLTVTKHSDKLQLLQKFISSDFDEFLTYLYALLSETQWDRVKEEILQSIIIYGIGGEGKNHVVNEVTNSAQHVNLIVQREKGALFQVYTDGDPASNHFVFVRIGEEEANALYEELGGSALVVRFLADPEM